MKLLTVLVSAALVLLAVVAFELARVNTSLQPLNRIPVTNAVAYGAVSETREQRIDRIARERVRLNDDENAIMQREDELKRERQHPARASR